MRVCDLCKSEDCFEVSPGQEKKGKHQPFVAAIDLCWVCAQNVHSQIENLDSCLSELRESVQELRSGNASPARPG